MADPNPRASVLIIDDNVDAADSLAKFLRVGIGADVRVAHDGEIGLKSAVQRPPDVIVCDIGLPRLDGLQFARQLASLLPEKPLLIAVTGYGGTYVESLARDAGFDHYFVKPADPAVIERLILSAGERPRAPE